jgi:hypothetical protein
MKGCGGVGAGAASSGFCRGNSASRRARMSSTSMLKTPGKSLGGFSGIRLLIN